MMIFATFFSLNVFRGHMNLSNHGFGNGSFAVRHGLFRDSQVRKNSAGFGLRFGGIFGGRFGSM